MIYSLITATNCRENKGIPCLKYVYVLCAKIFSHWKSRKTTKQKNKIEKLKYKSLKLPVVLLKVCENWRGNCSENPAAALSRVYSHISTRGPTQSCHLNCS